VACDPFEPPLEKGEEVKQGASQQNKRSLQGLLDQFIEVNKKANAQKTKLFEFEEDECEDEFGGGEENLMDMTGNTA